MWGRNEGAAETVYPAKSVTRRLRKGIKINDIMASRVLISLLQEGDRPFYSETWEMGQELERIPGGVGCLKGKQ